MNYLEENKTENAIEKKEDINILDLQALLEVFNEYDEFEKDLNKLLNKKTIIYNITSQKYNQ